MKYSLLSYRSTFKLNTLIIRPECYKVRTNVRSTVRFNNPTRLSQSVFPSLATAVRKERPLFL
jgi:hypothetical protein